MKYSTPSVKGGRGSYRETVDDAQVNIVEKKLNSISVVKVVDHTPNRKSLML